MRIGHRKPTGTSDHGIPGGGLTLGRDLDLERLVAMADAEMDRSKKTGKDRVSVFQSA